MGKDDDSINKVLNDCEIADESLLEQMGIGRAVYEELMSIVGHLPTIDEVSTLMAMWRSQGGRQSMLTWLKGQFHSVVQRDYLDDGNETASSLYREPEVGECIAIARALAESDKVSRGTLVEPFAHTGDAIYMVGDVSALFANSEYGRRYLHIAENPIAMDDDEETAHADYSWQLGGQWGAVRLPADSQRRSFQNFDGDGCSGTQGLRHTDLQGDKARRIPLWRTRSEVSRDS